MELDLNKLNRANAPSDASRVSLQRDLSIAVAEFAPGSRVVANKKVWTSYGLKKVVGREWDRREYFKCKRHGTFISWMESATAPGNRCCEQALNGRYIDPSFGFVSERKPPDDPSVRPSKVYTTRPYFSRSVTEFPEKQHIKDIISLTKASPGYLVVLCEGRKGKGFLICRECGAGLSTTGKKSTAKSHKTHYGRDCSGIAEHRVALGHEFLTDVLRLQFHPKTAKVNYGDIWFAYSVAYALLEGTAETLEVPTSDLSVTVKQSEIGSDMPEIVIYDNVPGGAGLVARLEDSAVLRECLEIAHHRVSGICGCAEATSCEGCLRSYANQFAHARLSRGPAKEFLADALSRWEKAP